MRTLAILASGVLAAGVAVTSVAQAAEPLVWQGEEFVTNVTPACTTNGDSAIGDFHLVVYRPFIAASADNLNPDGLLLVGSRFAVHLLATHTSLRGTASATETALGSHGGVSSDPTTVDLKITPAAITAKTTSVQITGKINNFFNEPPGCTITINASLLPRVD
jgi:hypothetical protein